MYRSVPQKCSFRNKKLNMNVVISKLKKNTMFTEKYCKKNIYKKVKHFSNNECLT